MSPALRIGWLVLPDDLITTSITTKATFDLGNSVLDQAALTELLRTGTFDRHLRRSRRRYRTQRQHVVDYLTTHLGDIEMTRARRGPQYFASAFPQPPTTFTWPTNSSQPGYAARRSGHYQQLPNPAAGLVIDIATSTIDHLDATITAIQASTPTAPFDRASLQRARP